MNQHHGLAAEPGSGRLTDAEGESCGNSGVDRVARRIENLHGRLGGKVMLGAGHTTARDGETLRPWHAGRFNVSQLQLVRRLSSEVAARWEIPFGQESALWPSAAGLVPASTAVVCGIGPVAKDLYTPNEAVERISLLQRTLLIAEFLANQT